MACTLITLRRAQWTGIGRCPGNDSVVACYAVDEVSVRQLTLAAPLFRWHRTASGRGTPGKLRIGGHDLGRGSAP
jgi:hypothetical protein